MIHSRSSSSASASSFDDDELFSDDGSYTTRTMSSQSTHHGRQPRKDKRYLEEPGPAHYGMKPGMPLRRHTKPEVAYTKYTLDPAPLMVPAVPSVPAPPRPSVLLPMQDIEQIKSEFYTAGRADGRAAERVESRLAEDAVMAAGYKSRASLSDRGTPPRRSSIRRVDPHDVIIHLDEDLERLRLDDERRYAYQQDVDDARRCRRYEEALVFDDRDRDSEPREWMRQRESSPPANVNPFTPRPRRNATSYHGRYHH